MKKDFLRKIMLCVFVGTFGSAFFACDDSASAEFLPRETSAEMSSSEVQSSSSEKTNSSSSKVQSSSSEKTISSSSKVLSSSSDKTNSSSSKVQSSSSEKTVSSSSTAVSSSSDYKSSSSSSKQNVSSSSKKVIVIEGEEIPYTTKCPEGVTCTYAPTAQLNPDIEYGEFLDERDYQVYKTLSFYSESGKKRTWLAQNLNLAYLAPTTRLDSSSFCYDNDPENCAKYGRLYLYSAIKDSSAVYTRETEGCGMGVMYHCYDTTQGICPDGWRLPTDDDDTDLVDYLRHLKRGDEIEHVRSSTGWSNDEYSDNDRGFSLLASGYRDDYGKYLGIGEIGGFWWSYFVGSDYGATVFVQSNGRRSYWGLEFFRDNAFPVRCVTR